QRRRPCRGNCSSLLAGWRTLPPNCTTGWRWLTGRANATSSERWLSGSKSRVTKSMSCFGSTHIRVITIPKKKVCNFVGGEISPLMANIYLNQLDQYIEFQYLNLSGTQRRRRRGQGRGNFLYTRYADDFVVLCNGTKAEALAMKEELRA